MRPLSLMLAIMVCVFACATSCFAQDRPISARAQLMSPRVYVGEEVEFLIDVQNSDHAEPPVVPTSPDYTLALSQQGNTSQRVYININGRQEDRSTRSFRFQYSLTPNRAGVVTIPPIAVKVDGDVYMTEAVRFTVIEPTVATDSRLVITPAKTTVYVGEPIEVTLTWYLDSNAYNPIVSMPELDSFSLLPPATPTGNNGPNPGERTARVRFNSGEASGRLGTATLDGEPHSTFSLRRILIPTTPGTISLGPAKISYQVATGQRQSRFGDSPFADTKIYERRLVTSEPVTLEVKPLPLPAPRNFTGLVGKFTIDVAATPTILNVGDPFTLSVRIGGPAPLDRVPPMDLSAYPGFSKGFKLPGDPSLPNVLPTAAIFSIDLRPLNDKVKEVPPIEVPYFDVDSGEYAVARSKPIPLKVRPTAEVTLDDAPPPNGPSGAANANDANEEKLHPNAPPRLARDLANAGTRALSIGQVLMTPAGAAIAAAPVALYALALLAGARQRRLQRHAGTARRRRAHRRALRRLRRASAVPEPAADVSASLRGYAADCLNVPEDGVTTAEAVALFAGRSSELEREAREVLAACDRAMFAERASAEPETESKSGPAATSELIDRARKLLTDAKAARAETLPSSEERPDEA